MRAAVFHGSARPLSIEAMPDPVPGPGQVIIEVSYCGICGTDLHLAEHDYVAPGTVFGHEFAGHIAAVGKEVAPALALGAPVTALPLTSCRTCDLCRADAPGLCDDARFVGVNPGFHGGYAPFVAVDAAMIQPVPAGVAFTDAAMVEPLAVAHHAVSMSGIARDSAVLVLGGGPIGQAAALFARVLGARFVMVSEPTASRRELARAMGASDVVDPREVDIAQTFFARAGRAPDIVIECVGVPGLIQQAITLCGKRGTVVVAGACFAPDQIMPTLAMGKELRLLFSQCYGESDFAAVIDAIATRRIDVAPLHTQTIALDAVPEAFASLARAPDQCKILIDPQRQADRP